MPLRTTASISPALWFRRFALIFLPSAAILTIAIVVSIRLDASIRLDRVRERETARVDIAKGLLLQDFSAVTSDLRILAAMPALRRYLDDSSPARRDDLSKLFLVVSKASGRYDQVRYLDTNGHEIIRINFNAGEPSIVPQEQLQDKSGRYYFRDTIKLGQGGIFVSPLDLNIEQNQLELPYKPTIRFGTPVFDSSGRKRGVIMLNYFGENLLQHFRNAMRGGDPRSAMLLNRDGFWLSSDKREDEWGFMRGKLERIFGQDFAAEWRTISATESGALQTDRGLFVYATVYPLQAGGNRSSSDSQYPQSVSQRGTGASEYYWKIVSLVSETALMKRTPYNQTGRRILFIVAYVLLTLGAAVIAYVSLGRKQARIALQENEERLLEIAGTMSEGLLVVDLSGKITYANREAASILGYSPDEMLGADMHELLHVRADGTLMPRDECNVLRVAQTGTTRRGMEETFRRKDGSLLPVLVSASAIIKERKTAGVVVAFHDIAERKQFERELERQARIDALTGLPNRFLFYDRLRHAVSMAKRNKESLALLYMDLDGFKNVNDTHGHHAGDLLLIGVAKRLSKCVRQSDTVARLGGDEFTIILETHRQEDIEGVAQKIIEAISAPFDLDGREVHIGISIGIAHYAEQADTEDELVNRADRAMYEAKSAGKNTYWIDSASLRGS